MATKQTSPISSSSSNLRIGSENKVAMTFPIIGIGASAGGLEAFEQFFHHIPPDSGMAFVLVPHLDPHHASLLTEILQRATVMPVVEALDQLAVKPNHVYIIPPNRNMEIFHGKLQLSISDAPRGLRMSIDTFLRSLAEDQMENAVGIILSGTGTDGTIGLRAILDAGGIALVQEPSTAKYDGMPSSAIKAGCVTHVLPVDRMWHALRLCTSYLAEHTEMLVTPKMTSGINQILMQLRNVTGHDFALYKKSTIGRRIERRMTQNNIDDTEVYARYLKENPSEIHILFKELLINVTSFFRDAAAFDVLEKAILPKLCEGKSDDYVFRVWVSGCSTGEEAYSIAILLCELTNRTNQNFKIQIYGTDLDDDAIAVARMGIYPFTIAHDITPERLQRFFIKEENGYRIKKEIREMVVFAIQNVIKDPPFTRLDLLSCRNLMIYLTAELQNRLIPTFHYALKPGGVLFLSPSEGICNHIELFSVLNRPWKFYRATDTVVSTCMMMSNPSAWMAQTDNKIPEEITTTKEINFAELTRRLLVQFFAPASVVTNLKGDILYVHGDTGKYLRPAPGHATLNVVNMAREGLGIELNTAIQSVASKKIPILNRKMHVKTNADFTTVSLSVRLVPSFYGSQHLLLVSFQDIDAVSPTARPSRKSAQKSTELLRIEELNRELTYLKENYLLNAEEHQISSEELKSANEELQSTNEEMQSTNEELETSKEELQSTNEELITVNAELQSKIEQLASVQNDMKNLLDNIGIGIIFLDRHLKIRRFTSEAVHIYRLVSSDVGRSLNDIKSIIGGDELLIAAQMVLNSLVPYEHEICVDENTWVLARIQPYRTLDDVIDGVVLTFTDISARIKIQTKQDAQRK